MGGSCSVSNLTVFKSAKGPRTSAALGGAGPPEGSLPSTTAPMTWWILPCFADWVLARRVKAGASLWTCRARNADGDGRAKARIERVTPLGTSRQRCSIESMGPAEDGTNLLSMVGDLTGEFGGEWRWIEDTGKKRVEVFRLRSRSNTQRPIWPTFSRRPRSHWPRSICQSTSSDLLMYIKY
jgi:hypothetical protein